jgi:hypothetical protein
MDDLNGFMENLAIQTKLIKSYKNVRLYHSDEVKDIKKQPHPHMIKCGTN